jgi:hypothetical protein
MRRKKPEVMDVDDKRLKDVADRAKKQQLEPEDAELIARVFESYKYVTGLIGEKNMSIGRLQKMLFGAKTETTNNVLGNASETQAVDSGEQNNGESNEAASEEADADADGKGKGKPPPKGHGRNAAEAYRGAERIEVPHPTHQAGDACPEFVKGTLYQQKPCVIVRIRGQARLGANK